MWEWVFVEEGRWEEYARDEEKQHDLIRYLIDRGSDLSHKRSKASLKKWARVESNLKPPDAPSLDPPAIYIYMHGVYSVLFSIFSS